MELELNYNLNCVVETTLLASNRPHSAQVAILQSHSWSLLPLLFLALCRFHMAEHSSTQKQEWLREKRVSSMWNNWSSSINHEQTNLPSGCFWLRVSLISLGSRSCRITNQSGATLWVLDTCLIVGLQPSMIILITASLS